jgi:hypothetical protein
VTRCLRFSAARLMPRRRFHRGSLNGTAWVPARLRIGNQHREYATSVVGQLYELALNLEWLQAQPDRDATIFRYGRYGLLQKIQTEIASSEYGRKTGRTTNAQRDTVLGNTLATQFDEFRVKDRADGTPPPPGEVVVGQDDS